MKETEFRALTHCGHYVDANRLEKGIYSCSKPFIYSKNESIETIVGRAKMMKDMTGQAFISQKYFDNLMQCQLVPIFISMAQKTFTREEVIKIIDELLQRPDILIDAVGNEMTDHDAESLLAFVENLSV